MSLERDRTRLELYYAAEEGILNGEQSSTVEGMTFTYGDLGRIQTEIVRLEARVEQQESAIGGFGVSRVVFGSDK